MSRYGPLSELLEGSTATYVSLTFAKIENILGFPLPRSASPYRGWWGNENAAAAHSQCRAWLRAGFRVSTVDLVNLTVSFRRLNDV
jgi:hypothetical protein